MCVSFVFFVLKVFCLEVDKKELQELKCRFSIRLIKGVIKRYPKWKTFCSICFKLDNIRPVKCYEF